MKRLLTNRLFVCSLICAPMFYGGFEYSASAELDAMEEPTVTMTQAQLTAHDAEIRIQVAREVLSAQRCTWKDTFVAPARKRS